ncbi:lipase chaperone [Pulveribacter suum]|uniref:Lipase helper protein n=2 Tax=Pulveribacter suum TaxID=2116657 RepID=A0A2P1NQ80_9BURK|nr:lipase chaperone [Pulveribacter suum]
MAERAQLAERPARQARLPFSADAPEAPGEPVAAPAQPAGAELPAAWRTSGNLRDRLEAWLLDAGPAADPAALKAQLAALVVQHFPPEEAAQALALVARYVDYRVALGELAAPADPGDPYALRLALDARQRLRQTHFGADEYQALFGADEAADRAMLARTEILRDPHLSEPQRAAALAAVEQQLPPHERALRSAAVQHEDVAAQTAAFDAQGVDPLTRQQQRATLYGQAASERLAALDTQEAHWQSRLASYAAAQARQAHAAELAQLRTQLFTPEESLRVEAALRVRQLGSQGAATR